MALYNSAMKPSTNIAMAQLLCQIRQHVPLDMPEAQVCSGICVGCPKKVLEFMEAEVMAWEQSLDNGDTPNLGDIQKLAKTAKKVQRVLQINNL